MGIHLRYAKGHSYGVRSDYTRKLGNGQDKNYKKETKTCRAVGKEPHADEKNRGRRDGCGVIGRFFAGGVVDKAAGGL